MRLARLALSALTTTALLGTGVASAAAATAPAADDPAAIPKVGTAFPYVGLVRAGGSDRYETAAIIARGSFQPSANSAVFVTSGEAPPDALSAGPAAASLDAPLLLTRATDLPAATASELTRLAPSTVYVVGGTDRISADVLASITAASPGATVTRIAGVDRYDTSVRIADAFFPAATGVVVTRGDTFPDALSGGAAAAAAGQPLMLTQPTEVPAPVVGWLARQTFAAATVVGGTTSVSDAVAASFGARVTAPGAVTRIAGSDRYETATLVASTLFPDATTVVLATGDNFPDALAGVPAAAVNDAPMLLLPQQCAPVSVIDYLGTIPLEAEIILGGPEAVTPEALSLSC